VRRFVLALLVGGSVLNAGGSSAQTPREQIVFARGGDLWAVPPDRSGSRRLTDSDATESTPALSPDGTRVAYASDASGEREIYIMRAEGTRSRRLTQNPGRDDTAAAWSPDGRRLAWSSQGDVYVMNADGSAKRPVAATSLQELDPAWSPDGLELVYSAGGDLFVVPAGGGTPRQLTSGPANDRQPDWSSRGELVYAGDTALFAIPAAGGAPRQLTASTPADSSPSWAPDGLRIVFVRAGAGGSDLYVANADGSASRRLSKDGAEPHWGRLLPPPPKPPPGPPPNELLPDLEQRAPHGLTIRAERGRFRLGFASAVDNVGAGPVWLLATRTPKRGVMRASQYIALRGGGRRIYRNAGLLRYTPDPPHHHWHYLGFERYELRRAGNFRLLVRDRKSGFCLADHYGHAGHRVRVARAKFLGRCGQFQPLARRIEQGSSVGYTDRYPAHFHGQNLDVTGLIDGRYWLIHRANSRRRLREQRYGNNAAAVLIRLRWPDGHGSSPAVSVLRVCQGSERC
jgi:WD40-like Beta Propeller Repeat/Lysyl oxidase